MDALTHYLDSFSKRDLKISIPKRFFKIEDDCFRGNDRMRKLSLPESLKHLGDRAFEGCRSLEEVKFRGRPVLTYISEWCFAGCANLREVYLPDSISIIKSYAFKDCTSLKKLEVPRGVIVENGAFDGWTEEQIILVHEEVSWGIACRATIINVDAEEYDELALIFETVDGEKMYAVDTKCGHVGNHRYMPITFPIKAHTAKEAAKIARTKPRVKHDHKDAILDVRQISMREFKDLSVINHNDKYLHLKSKYQQKIIETEINARTLTETRLVSLNKIG